MALLTWSCPLRIVLIPYSLSVPNALWIFGLRISKSKTITFLSNAAIIPARLEHIKVLPSATTLELTVTNLLFFSDAKNCRLALNARRDSLNNEYGSARESTVGYSLLVLS